VALPRSCASPPRILAAAAWISGSSPLSARMRAVYGRASHHDEACGGAELCVPGLFLKCRDERIDLLACRTAQTPSYPPAGPISSSSEPALPPGPGLPSALRQTSITCRFLRAAACFRPHVLVLIFQGITQRFTCLLIRNLPESINRRQGASLSLPSSNTRKRGSTARDPNSPSARATPHLTSGAASPRCSMRTGTDSPAPMSPIGLRRHNPDDRHRIVQRLFERPEGVCARRSRRHRLRRPEHRGTCPRRVL